MKTDQLLTEKIQDIQDDVKRRYGSPRVRIELKALGFPAGKHRVARLMSEAGVLAITPKRFRVTTNSAHQEPVAESFFATLPKELLGDRPFATRTETSRELFEFIEIWYIRKRRHSTLGYRTPVEYETRMLRAS